MPAGQYLTYLRGACTNTDPVCILRAISRDGSFDQAVVKNLPDTVLAYRSGKIAFTSEFHPPDKAYGGIQVLDLKSGEYLEIPQPQGKWCDSQDWSPDGTQLVVLCGSYFGSIVIDISLLSIPEGKEIVLLHDSNENNDSDGYYYPRWSPDGKWLLFYKSVWTRSPELIENYLYILDLSCLSNPTTCQGMVRRLQIDDVQLNRPIAWTPDGHLSRAIDTWNKSDSSQLKDSRIEIIDISNRNLLRTIHVNPEYGGISTMAWSPDGEWVAINQSYSRKTLIVPVNGGQPMNLEIDLIEPFWISVPLK